MVARVKTVAFLGIDARPVDVEVQIAGGLPAFSIVGLPDKAVSEARDRVRAALDAVGLLALLHRLLPLRALLLKERHLLLLLGLCPALMQVRNQRRRL
jgi:hypothetical protein